MTVIRTMDYIDRAIVRENPTLGNIESARRRARREEYSMQRALSDARAEANAARHDATVARRQAAEATEEAKQARRQAEAASMKLEGEYRKTRTPHVVPTPARNMTYEVSGVHGPVELIRDTRLVADSGSHRALKESEEASRKVVEGVRRETEIVREQTRNAQKAAMKATEMIKITNEAQQEAEKCLEVGIQPIIIPTVEEVAAAKAKVQYDDNLFHFAVTGVSGTGKSSLINAFRGLHNKDQGAAQTGVVETTFSIDRYPDPSHPFVWCDIPGAGTLQQSDWLYFNNQGLFIFDCIVLLFDTRFTATDVAILTNCRRFQIPTYIVRSKSDVHIRNIMRDMGYESDNDGRERRQELHKTAQEQYIAETRATVQSNLQEVHLQDQKVYTVCNTSLLSIIKNHKISPRVIDELDLINDLLNEARSRRCIPQ